MADTDLQALLDVGDTGHGIRIQRRETTATTHEYYLTGNVTGVGKCMWVSTLSGDSDATKDTAIRAAFGVA